MDMVLVFFVIFGLRVLFLCYEICCWGFCEIDFEIDYVYVLVLGLGLGSDDLIYNRWVLLR